MTKYRKTFIIALVIAVICVPVALNFVCLTAFPAPLIGDGKLWLTFWGSYIGGMLPVLTAIYVLDEEHRRDCYRKDYEIQKEYFDSLCVNLGKLCSTIDTDILCFYLMNMTKIENANETIREIGKLEKDINCEYNEFCLKYAHYRGEEGGYLLDTYSDYAKLISYQIGMIQEAVVNRKIAKINESDYNAIIRKACDELEKKGDIRMELLCLADKWKKREFERTEAKRKKYESG